MSVGRPRGRFTQHKRMSELRQLLVQHPKGVTLVEIAAHLDVTPRSARRYLQELRYDLEAIPERPGGQKRWRIPPVDLPRRVALRRTQAYALLASVPLFEPMRGTALFEEIDLAAQTLVGLARRPGRGPNAGVAEGALEQRFRYLPFAPKDYSNRAEDLDALFQSVADRRPLSCRIPATEPDTWDRVRLHPLALLLYKDAIFCLAADAVDIVRTLPVDAIVDAHTLDEPRFTIPEDFDVDDYIQGQFGIWRAETEPQRVVIDLDASVAAQVTSRSVHPSQRVEPLADGVRLHLEIADLTEVATWVLGFGPRAEVIEPASLRAAVADELRRALDRYR